MQRIVLPMAVMTALLLAAGCGARQERFEPAEKLTAKSPEGYSAAEYDLNARQQDLGEAKVWSNGAFRKEIRGRKRTVVHVGFLLENRSGQPMVLSTEELQLSSATLNRRVLEDIEPVAVEGIPTIKPDSQQRIDVYFGMPAGISPEKVDAFMVRWKLRAGDLTYSQETPFLESRSERYAGMYFYTPFYDPFYYDPYIFHPRVVIHRYPYRHYHVFR